MTDTPTDSTEDLLVRISDLLELAARRVWHRADTQLAVDARSAGLALYLLHSRVHAQLSPGQQRTGIDPAEDERSGLALLLAVEDSLRALGRRDEQSAGQRALSLEVAALIREVRGLEE